MIPFRFRIMPSKTAKSSTAAAKSRGKGSQPRSDSEDELVGTPKVTRSKVTSSKETSSSAQEEAPPTTGK